MANKQTNKQRSAMASLALPKTAYELAWEAYEREQDAPAPFMPEKVAPPVPKVRTEEEKEALLWHARALQRFAKTYRGD